MMYVWDRLIQRDHSKSMSHVSRGGTSSEGPTAPWVGSGRYLRGERRFSRKESDVGVKRVKFAAPPSVPSGRQDTFFAPNLLKALSLEVDAESRGPRNRPPSKSTRL